MEGCGGQGGVWGGGGKKAFHLSHPMKLDSFVSIALMFLLKLFSNPLLLLLLSHFSHVQLCATP